MMLTIVLDTNIILSSVSSASPFHTILKSLSQNKYTLLVTNDILLEYEEKLTVIFSREVAEFTISALLYNKCVKKIESYFNLQLIKADEDDNKFVDCAFTGNAHYLVTNDRHFNVLKQISFPSINVITIHQFMEILKSQP
jgi:uncharacterized protein